MTKRITLALAMIGLSASAFAGTMGNPVAVPAGINLIAPDSTGMWSFGVEGLWAIDNNQNFQYASVVSGVAADLDHDNKSVEGENDWGIAANIQYMFAGNSRDVNLQYTGVFLNDSNSTHAPLGVVPVFPLDGEFGNFDEATGSSEQDLNRVDLTFGQLIRIGDRVDLHPFAGVSFANIDVDNRASYFREVAATDTDLKVADFKGDSNFWGVGPSVGIDGAVHLGGSFMNGMFDGFSIVGRAGAALFVGDMSSSFKSRTGTLVSPLSTEVEYENDDVVTVVPELDARLGLDYNYAFNPNTSMNVQIGYEVANYFNAISQDSTDATFVNSTNNTSSFNYYGPYLRLQLNVA